MVLNPRASPRELTHAFSSAEAEREGGLNFINKVNPLTKVILIFGL
jgi:hypothetical protein